MQVLGGEDKDEIQKLIHVRVVLDSESFPQFSVLRAMRVQGVFFSLLPPSVITYNFQRTAFELQGLEKVCGVG